MNVKTNADLQKDVYDELRWDPRITEADIGVSVINGVVTLSGNIPTFAEKWAAEEATRKVSGVTAVVNQIDVKLPGHLVKDDQEIAEAAIRAFEWNVWVPQGKIKIMVEKGWVTLTGEVEHDYQRRSAEKAVLNLSGVRGVINEVTVEPPLKSKDIQLQIKRALHRHAEEDAENVHVEVANGTVTLTGKVHSWDEKENAEWAALGTMGVRDVKNHLSVSYA